MKPEIYKDHYQFEWDHKSHLTSALNIPIGVATVIGGAIALMVKKYPYHQDFNTIGFVALISFSALLIVIAAYYLFKALHGYQYQRIPTPKTLKTYYDDLLQWHESYGNGKQAAEEEFNEYFHQRMAEAVDVNAHNNKSKSGYLYRTNVLLAISLLFVAFSSVPFLVKTIAARDQVHSIRIVEMPELSKEKIAMPDDDQNDQNEQTTTTDQTPEAPPAKPTPPPNENIKEHVVPPTTEKIIKERDN